MDDKKLKQFYDDTGMRNAWTDFIMEVLKQEIIKRAFAGGDVKDIAEAKNVLILAFSVLNDTYTKKEERQVDNRAL